MVFKNTYSTSQAAAFVEVGWLGIPTLGSRNKTYLIVVLVSFIKRCVNIQGRRVWWLVMPKLIWKLPFGKTVGGTPSTKIGDVNRYETPI